MARYHESLTWGLNCLGVALLGLSVLLVPTNFSNASTPGGKNGLAAKMCAGDAVCSNGCKDTLTYCDCEFNISARDKKKFCKVLNITPPVPECEDCRCSGIASTNSCSCIAKD